MWRIKPGSGWSREFLVPRRESHPKDCWYSDSYPSWPAIGKAYCKITELDDGQPPSDGHIRGRGEELEPEVVGIHKRVEIDHMHPVGPEFQHARDQPEDQ